MGSSEARVMIAGNAGGFSHEMKLLPDIKGAKDKPLR